MRRPYDSKLWRSLRLEVLERDGRRCQIDDCDAEATVVDHIIPWLEAPHLAFEKGNLRSSCVYHNAARVKQPQRVGTSARRTSRDW